MVCFTTSTPVHTIGSSSHAPFESRVAAPTAPTADDTMSCATNRCHTSRYVSVSCPQHHYVSVVLGTIAYLH